MKKYGKLWVAAEVFLFVLVGAAVNIGYLGNVGVKAIVVIIGALVFRMFGVFLSLLGTDLSANERLFAKNYLKRIIEIVNRRQNCYYYFIDVVN